MIGTNGKHTNRVKRGSRTPTPKKAEAARPCCRERADDTHGVRLAVWEKLLDALEDAYVEAERTAGCLLDASDEDAVLEHLDQAYCLVLFQRPRKPLANG